MVHNPAEILEHGCAILDAVLRRDGFKREQIVSGKGSGGDFATTLYLNGNRKLVLHFRFSLGLISYHFGLATISHEAFMKAALGPKGGNKYPGFSDQPLSAFRDLAYDLETHCSSFLTGNESEFARYVEMARRDEALKGFERLANSES